MQPGDIIRVGIIGAGRIGQAMAQTALRAGRHVVIANSRGPESLTSVVSAVVALFEDAGFVAVDLGGLREGGQMQQVGAPLAGHNLIRLP